MLFLPSYIVWAENCWSEIIFSQNFKNIAPFSSFFSIAVETWDAWKILFHYFDFFSFLEVWRIFFLRVMKFYVMCHGISLFLSISAGFRIVSLNLEFISSVLEISLNDFFDFLPFVFSIPSLEFLWVSYWVSWVSLTFLSVFIYFPFLFLYLPTFWEIFLNFVFQFLHEGLFSAFIFIISKHLISENIFNAVFVL